MPPTPTTTVCITSRDGGGGNTFGAFVKRGVQQYCQFVGLSAFVGCSPFFECWPESEVNNRLQSGRCVVGLKAQQSKGRKRECSGEKVV